MDFLYYTDRTFEDEFDDDMVHVWDEEFNGDGGAGGCVSSEDSSGDSDPDSGGYSGWVDPPLFVNGDVVGPLVTAAAPLMYTAYFNTCNIGAGPRLHRGDVHVIQTALAEFTRRVIRNDLTKICIACVNDDEHAFHHHVCTPHDEEAYLRTHHANIYAIVFNQALPMALEHALIKVRDISANHLRILGVADAIFADWHSGAFIDSVLHQRTVSSVDWGWGVTINECITMWSAEWTAGHRL